MFAAGVDLVPGAPPAVTDIPGAKGAMEATGSTVGSGADVVSDAGETVAAAPAGVKIRVGHRVRIEGGLGGAVPARVGPAVVILRRHTRTPIRCGLWAPKANRRESALTNRMKAMWGFLPPAGGFLTSLANQPARRTG